MGVLQMAVHLGAASISSDTAGIVPFLCTAIVELVLGNSASLIVQVDVLQANVSNRRKVVAKMRHRKKKQ